MSHLINALKSVAKENRKDSEQISAITETQRLIAGKGAEDMDMLKNLGMHHSVAKAINLHGNRIELERLEKKYGEIFTSQDIKNIACKYALKFLRSDNYRGAIEPVMLQKIKQFYTDNNMEINATDLGYKFYVLAPPKAFELVDRPKPAPIDPILFYKLDENNFKLIHKWGADLTPFRRLVGIHNQSKVTRYIGIILSYLVMPIIFGILYHYDKTIYGPKECSNYQAMMWLFILAPVIVYGIIWFASFNDEHIPFRNFKPWSERYNDNYKD